MVAQTQRGFTIIEVMLFLAISGLLFAMLMVGANNGITQQRYLDSVRSYKAFLQNQYSEVLNTRNSRNTQWKCDASGAAVDTSGVVSTPGTDTNCIILGRVIRISSSGDSFTVANVTGHIAATASPSDDLQTYSPTEVPETETWEMDWGSQLKADDANPLGPNGAVILILRSPVSGLMKIYTDPNPASTANHDMSNMVDASHTTKLCHYIDGSSGTLPKQWITINPKIASADGVSTSEGGCS